MDKKELNRNFVEQLGELLEKHGLTSPGEFIIHYELFKNEDGTVSFKYVGIVGGERIKKAKNSNIQNILISVAGILLGTLISLLLVK